MMVCDWLAGRARLESRSKYAQLSSFAFDVPRLP
jgi:hypothetical protein